MKPIRILAVLVALAVIGFVVFRGRGPDPGPAVPAEPASGGRLVGTIRSEPATYNRFVSPNFAEEVLTHLTHDRLVRQNRRTGQLEPRLASSWTVSDDGLVWTMELRPGVLFSDGTPLTSADVLFSFRAAHDPDVASDIGPNLTVGGQPILAAAVDDDTVVVTFPEVYGPGIGLLESLPILPRHRLAAALEAGLFADAWNVETPLDQVTGLGPFVLTEHAPGQRLVFTRNPHFWGTDATGRPLPYLDQIELQVVTDQNAEMLRLEAGDLDLTAGQIRAEDYATFKRMADAGQIQLVDAGVTTSPPWMTFNLVPGSRALTERPWLANRDFRRAVSHAIDRQAIVDTVYLGAAEPIYGPITPGHGAWFLPDLPKNEYDPGAAAALLESIGLVDGDGDGQREDSSGRPVRFSVMVNRGRTSDERTVALVQEQLRRVGVGLDIAALERGEMLSRFGGADYEAMYFYVVFNSMDPAESTGFWLSSGPFHFWQPGQASPATEWEATIDDLVLRQASTIDAGERRRMFERVQRLLATEQPMLHLVAPKVLLAMSPRVQGATPSVIPPSVLWNAEVLSVAGAR